MVDLQLPGSAGLTLSLSESIPAVELAGGKGRSLAMLAAAGLPVPAGFVVSTQAYRAVIASDNLDAEILQLVRHESLDVASSEIAARLQAIAIPAEISDPILAARVAIAGVAPVAVRSSATAEDLPNASFAGQHTSFLNIRSDEALLRSLRACWASLWSARAIAYRDRMSLDHRNSAMAVVIQEMLEAEVSGVLFTANPTTGSRLEMVIEGSYGLGESIVSGQVTPDTWLVDRDRLCVVSADSGSKAEMVVSAEEGTNTVSVPDGQRQRFCLTEQTVLTLADLALKAEQVFAEQPQDMEWVVSGGECWLVQSRPITNLPTAIEEFVWMPPPGAEKLVRRQVVENMPGPLSPLFEELYLTEGLERGMDRLMREMGLNIQLDRFIKRPIFVTSNGYGYCRYDIMFGWHALRVLPTMLYFYTFRLPGIIRTLIPFWRDTGLAEYQTEIERWQAKDPEVADDRTLLEGIRMLALADATYWFFTTAMVGAAKITEGLLGWLLSSRKFNGELTSGMFLAGFASRTIAGEQALEAIADRIREDDILRDLVLATPVARLLGELDDHPAGAPILADLQRYLEDYGHQVYDLDFVQPTQIEDPTPVLMGVKSLILSPGSAESRQAEFAARQEVLIGETQARFGPFRRRLFNRFLSWAQRFGPYREEALFYMGAAWPTLRALARELGRRLVGSGVLATIDDIFYLQTSELESAISLRLSPQAASELRAAAQDRRALRDARKRLHPPGRVPEDVRFKYGPFDITRFIEPLETQKRNTSDDTALNGFAVSPGTVTGPACLIRSPTDFERMRPDSILVCPTTTPAWTPLFSQATGLVTDIGAVLAHGSIVAREYGIPAVLGCGNATQRIQDGQTITVDGSAGVVDLQPVEPQR